MRVSILIPCYNAERWIAQAINSALAQTWADKEVIVVDDGSTDRSLEIIRGYEGRIHWETGANRGGNAARNRLLEMASGEWLQYLDADDYLLPDKIERQVHFLEARGGIDVVFGPSIMEYWSDGAVRHEPSWIPEPHDPWILLARWYLPQTGASLWRAQALRDVGGWAWNQPCCQEHELYLRLLMAGKSLAYFGQYGSIYRHWSEQTVCKRDKPETRRRRLEIEQRAELFLAGRGKLTEARRWAINQARFEIARTTWKDSADDALVIMRTVARSQPGFRPGGAAAPRRYRIVYSLLGFRAAEWIAHRLRSMRQTGA